MAALFSMLKKNWKYAEKGQKNDRKITFGLEKHMY